MEVMAHNSRGQAEIRKRRENDGETYVWSHAEGQEVL